MSVYHDIQHLPFGDVVSEKQFQWLKEIVFLSALDEVLRSGPVRRPAGEGVYPEQLELLQRIFGMSPDQFDERIEAFMQYKRRKGEPGE